jgi:hypothetical protein
MILEEYLKMVMPFQSPISFNLLGAFLLRMSLEFILLSIFFHLFLFTSFVWYST